MVLVSLDYRVYGNGAVENKGKIVQDILEPGQEEREGMVAVGIDLGTSNSLIAQSSGGKVQIFEDDMGVKIMPSVVAYHAGAEPLVGLDAAMEKMNTPEVVVSSVKRIMGKGIEDAGEYRKHVAFDLVGTSEAVRLSVGGKKLSPVEVSADILKALKARAGQALGQEVKDAIITVPAYFDDAQRQATRDAARLAGINVLRLLAEPTAAAVAYGLDKQTRGTYMVYDFGGGTFDVSILKLQEGIFQVVATGGDTYLGGDDIDAALAEGLNIPIMDAKHIKEHLTDEEEVHGVTRKQMEEIAEPIITKTINLCGRAVRDAEMDTGDLDGIILVGGSSRMPLIQTMLEDIFGVKCVTGLDPEEVVAHGAALQAEALTSSEREDLLLLDVTPLSLGVETMGGLVEKIILRNSPIPISKAQTFTTFKEGQTAMDIHVLQGERETVEGCRSLAKFKLSGIPNLPVGAARIEVTFSIDADGLLTVSAKEETTGNVQTVDVVPSYGLSEEEVVGMLKASITSAKEDVGERQAREAKVELERVCDACYSLVQRMCEAHEIDDEEMKGYEQSVDAARSFLEMPVLDAVMIEEAIQTLEETFKPLSEKVATEALVEALAGKQIGDGTEGSKH